MKPVADQAPISAPAHFICLETATEILSGRHADHYLAFIRTAEKQLQGFSRVLEPVHQVRTMLQLALGEQIEEHCVELGVTMFELRNDESFHPRLFDEHERKILDSVCFALGSQVILRDCATDHNAATNGHIFQDSVKRRPPTLSK
ncbi:hypothetical protein NMB33_24750 [Burkholderia sp. FXe9]|nr:hypothetical protein NMB33_24750 [Burkholderia sp. FXe9]